MNVFSVSSSTSKMSLPIGANDHSTDSMSSKLLGLKHILQSNLKKLIFINKKLIN